MIKRHAEYIYIYIYLYIYIVIFAYCFCGSLSITIKADQKAVTNLQMMVERLAKSLKRLVTYLDKASKKVSNEMPQYDLSKVFEVYLYSSFKLLIRCLSPVLKGPFKDLL